MKNKFKSNFEETAEGTGSEFVDNNEFQSARQLGGSSNILSKFSVPGEKRSCWSCIFVLVIILVLFVSNVSLCFPRCYVHFSILLNLIYAVQVNK